MFETIRVLTLQHVVLTLFSRCSNDWMACVYLVPFPLLLAHLGT